MPRGRDFYNPLMSPGSHPSLPFSNGDAVPPKPPREERGQTVVICGAGPAGLTAAYELAKRKIEAQVLEADPVYVGGISRTVQYRGYRFDIGGHRFFSKSAEIEQLWDELLGPELLRRDRMSRIYYRGKFYFYPIRASNAMWNLGAWEALLCGLSYLRAKVRPTVPTLTFEQWVTNQFGARLYRTFFKTYTEKVWGISTQELSADWAAQRIRGLSLASLVANILPKTLHSHRVQPKTLIDHFRYPRQGPGQCWEAAAAYLASAGRPVAMGERVVAIMPTCDGRLIVASEGADGSRTHWFAQRVISSLPLRDVVRALRPSPPSDVIAAADQLRYRDFLTVGLVVDRESVFPDNWIYIHEPEVQVGRIQNFKNWSPGMTPDPTHTHLGLEYFCFEGDGLWTTSDRGLLALAASELETLGLCLATDVVDGVVIRQPKAYPVYDALYADRVATIRDWLATHVPALACVGRNGMHKYNNQDHSMMTALLAARRIAGVSDVDPWQVNSDAEYHEGDVGWEVTERTAPMPLGVAPVGADELPGGA